MRRELELLEARLLLDATVLPTEHDGGAEVEPNDTRDLATQLPLSYYQMGMPCTFDLNTGAVNCPPTLYSGYGSLSSHGVEQGDVDFWSIKIAPASVIRISMQGDTVSLGVQPLLLDQDGSVLATAQPQDTDRDGVPDSEVLEYFAGSGGQFFIQLGLEGPHDGPTDYALHAAVSHEPNVEHEPNDTLAHANPIELEPVFPCGGLCMTGSASAAAGIAQPSSTAASATMPIRFPGPWFDERQHGFIEGSLDNRKCGADFLGCGADTDFFSFSTAAEREITLSFDGVAASGVLPQLLDSNGTVLATAQAHDTDGNGTPDGVTLDYFTRDGGQFYVQVGPDPQWGGGRPQHETYSLTVDVVLDPHHEHEPNNDFDTANTIELAGNSWGNCEFVCPLAAGATGTATSAVHASAVGVAFPLPIWRGDRSLHGFVAGELESELAVQCASAEPPAVCEVADLAPDVDYFAVDIPPEMILRITLDGPLATNGGTLSLYDAQQTQLVWEANPADGINLVWTEHQGGRFYVRVMSSADGYLNTPLNPTEYVLGVTAAPIPNPVEGPDENEPNDTPEQADDIELDDLPLGACCISLRGGDAQGIAGGPTHDQDFWQFDVSAGEHVTVGVHQLIVEDGGGMFQSIDDWEAEHHLNKFGDPTGTVYHGGSPLPKKAANDPAARLAYVLHAHSELSVVPVEVVVRDANGDEIGRGGDDGSGVKAVEFDAPADGTYSAVVSAAAEASGDSPLAHYRIGVLARGAFVQPLWMPATNPEPPKVVVLDSKGTFDYTDSDGDRVHIAYRGRRGKATITFTGPDADGSDIASIIIDGARGGGTLLVQTSGTAEIGSVEVHGWLVDHRVIGNLAKLQVDGDVGSLSSDVDLRSVAVDGVLGELAAHGHRITQLDAGVFDLAAADVGGIRKLHVEQDIAAALFDRFIPWHRDLDS